MIAAGADPTALSRGIHKATEVVSDYITSSATAINEKNKKEIQQIATIAGNSDSSIGGVLADGFLKVGAMTRHSVVERSSEVRESVPLLSQAVPLIGHAAIRNRATLGGSLVHNHPASELPAVAAALEARIEVRSPSSSRTLSAQEFFTSYLTTALEENELVTEVGFPILGPGWRTSFLELSRRVGDFALVGVAVATRLEAGKCVEARIALTGVGGIPTRVREAEGVLRDSTLEPEVMERAAEAVKDEVEPLSDFHGSSDYRRHLCGVLTRRALEAIAGGE